MLDGAGCNVIISFFRSTYDPFPTHLGIHVVAHQLPATYAFPIIGETEF